PRPVRRRSAARLPAAIEPGAHRDEREPEQKNAGENEKKENADVRVRVQPEEIGEKHREKQNGAERGERDAGQRNSVSNDLERHDCSPPLHLLPATSNCYLQLLTATCNC